MTTYERSAEIERAEGAQLGVVAGVLATDGEASDGHIIDMDGLEAEAPKPLLFGHNAWDADGTLGSWRSFAKSKHALRGTAAIETDGEGWLADARRDLALMVSKGHIGSFSLRWEPTEEPVRRTSLSKDHPAFVDAQKDKDYRKLYGLYFPRSRVVEGSIVVVGADAKAKIGRAEMVARMAAAAPGPARAWWRGAIESALDGERGAKDGIGDALGAFHSAAGLMRAHGIEDFGTLIRLCEDGSDPRDAVAVEYGAGKRILIPRGAYDALCGEAAQRLALAFDLVTFDASEEDDEAPLPDTEVQSAPTARLDAAPPALSLDQVRMAIASANAETNASLRPTLRANVRAAAGR